MAERSSAQLARVTPILFALTWVLVLSSTTPCERKYVTPPELENMQLNPYNRYYSAICNFQFLEVD